MALIIKDRVKETTTTTGTGTITLAGASTGFRSFADIGNANTTYYTIAGGNNWEVGLGTYTASSTTLSRDTVLSNSLGTTALIDFSAGDKDVFCTYPSEKALLGDTSAVSSTGTGSVVLSDSPTIIGTVDLSGASVVDVTDVEGGLVTIGRDSSESNSGTFTTIKGSSQLGGDVYDAVDINSPLNINAQVTASNSATFNSGANINGTLQANGSLSLTGSNTANQSIATSQTTGTLTIGGTSASASGAINIGSGTGGQSISIASAPSNTGSKTINIASGSSTAAKTINIGTGTATTSTSNIGSTTATTSNVNLNGTVGLVGATNTMSINPTQTTGQVNIGGTSGTGQITLGRSTDNQTINIGTGAVASTKTKTIKIGTGNGGGSTVIQLGNDSTTYCAIEAHGSILQTVTSTITNVVFSAGARSFTDSHYSSSVYPPFGEVYSDSGTFGPFTVPLYHDGSDWRVG